MAIQSITWRTHRVSNDCCEIPFPDSFRILAYVLNGCEFSKFVWVLNLASKQNQGESVFRLQDGISAMILDKHGTGK